MIMFPILFLLLVKLEFLFKVLGLPWFAVEIHLSSSEMYILLFTKVNTMIMETYLKDHSD